MVISPYNTVFTASPIGQPTRLDSSAGIRPNAESSYDLRNQENKQQQTRRSVNQTELADSDIFLRRQSLSTPATTRETVTHDSPDQFSKVQTFIQIREFEDSSQLIDTFV